MNNSIVRWIKIVVLKTLREKKLTHLDVESLISAGNVGYAQALQRFDKERGVKFKTYAEYRIKGAVLDEVRKIIGDERCKSQRPVRVRDYDMSLSGDSGDFQREIESSLDITKFLVNLPLDERCKNILECRLLGMNLKEIGDKFGFSESRASQLLAQVRKKVKPFMEERGIKFDIVGRICPKCQHLNEARVFTTSLDCVNCHADIVIIGSNLIIREVDKDEEGY